MKYSDKNLIKYEDTILLHFDEKGDYAWLTLKNYGGVFNNKSPHEVTEAIVGEKAGEESLHTISIGEMLDAIDVIKFQGEMAIFLARPRVFTREQLNKKIEGALRKIGVANPHITYEPGDTTNFWFTTYHSLLRVLNSRLWLRPPEVFKIKWANKEREADTPFSGNPNDLMDVPISSLVFPFRGETISHAIKEFDRLHFTAYFPKPSLIIQEEVTEPEAQEGRTTNHDLREIKPIPTNMSRPPKYAFDEFIKQLDKEIKEGGVKPGTLHSQLKRIMCFGFRGDDRGPLEIEESGGFLPGITRTDAGVAKFAKEAAKLEGTRTYDGQNLLRSWRLQKEYIDAIKEYGVLHLGAYTEKQYFKGYISATTSVAIAKCFANYWKEPKLNIGSYIYAVRCKGGFQLPSTLKHQVRISHAAEKLKELHEFVHFAEQEVAVAGAIWWHNDIVGMRAVRCEAKGQFFCGPVFLQDLLKRTDSNAFSALFELYSGKSQGKGLGINKSYPTRPW